MQVGRRFVGLGRRVVSNPYYEDIQAGIGRG
jgi:hypothetical protein